MIFGFYSILAGAAYFFGKCINDAADRDVAEANYIKSGRKERDRLHDLWSQTGVPSYKRDEIIKRAGRWPIPLKYELWGMNPDADFEVAVNQIAIKEGWSYKTNGHGYPPLKGEYFARFLGEEWKDKKYLTYEEVAIAMNEETERRKEWEARCPRSNEVEIIPMGCEDEDDYRKRVKQALTDRWYEKYNYFELPYGLNAYDYEDEEDFLKDKEKFDNYYSKYNIYKEAPKDKRHNISNSIYKVEKFLFSYDVENLTSYKIDTLFVQIRKKYKWVDQYMFQALEERLTMLGYGEYIAERKRKEATHKSLSPKDLVFFSENNSSLPSPTPEQNPQNEPSDPAEHGPETSDTAVSEPKPVKTEFIVPPIGYGKIYTMQRGNKKSKLTLTKRM